MIKAQKILESAVGSAFPGCQAWVARNGEVLLHTCLGKTSQGAGGEDVTPETLYDLASVTKAIGTTVVLMRLYDQGAIDLNRRIVRDLGRFPWPPFLVDGTYLSLLNHRSGLLGYKELFLNFKPSDLPLPGQARTALAARMAAIPQSYRPGTRCEYSDFGFMLIGWALERLCEVPLSALFHAHLSSALGLTNLTTSDSDAPPLEGAAPTEHCPWRKEVVCGHVHDEHAFLLGGCAGHAGLFGAAADIGHVGTVLLDAFHGRSAKFLSQHTVQRFWNPSNSLNGASFRLGFDGATETNSQAGSPPTPWTVGHLGFTGTSLWIYPEINAVAVLNTNRVHPNRNNLEIQDIRRRFHSALLTEFGATSPEQNSDKAPQQELF